MSRSPSPYLSRKHHPSVIAVDSPIAFVENEEEEPWWEGEIVAQKGKKYKIEWKGVDPTTGKPYKPTWVCVSEKNVWLMCRNLRRIALLRFFRSGRRS
jgi:hypothetical protein